MAPKRKISQEDKRPKGALRFSVQVSVFLLHVHRSCSCNGISAEIVSRETHKTMISSVFLHTGTYSHLSIDNCRKFYSFSQERVRLASKQKENKRGTEVVPRKFLRREYLTARWILSKKLKIHLPSCNWFWQQHLKQNCWIFAHDPCFHLGTFFSNF